MTYLPASPQTGSASAKSDERIVELEQELERLQRQYHSLEEALDRKPISDRHVTDLRLQRLVQNSTDILGLVDPLGQLLGVYGATQQVFGCPREALFGHTLFDSIHETDRPRIHELFQQALAHPWAFFSAECRVRHHDGHWLPISATFLNLLDDPYVSAVALSCRDISNRKQLEQERDALEAQLQQSRKLESIGRLAGGIAHDFNNLLTAIVGNVELARASASACALKEHLDEITRASQRATDLTRQLLAFSRRQFIEPKDVSVNEQLSQIERMLRRLIREDIELRIVLGNAESCVRIDPGQLEQVIVNLAVNARDAMPGGGTLVIETTELTPEPAFCTSQLGSPASRYVRLSVSDTGEGIAPEVRPHIFEPFFTTKGIAEGTGLGLATVHSIVEQAGGRILVSSEIGVGSTFTVYLPVSTKADSTALARKVVNGSAPTGTETILLVEDDCAVRSVALTLLERLGYVVHPFPSGEEALAFVRQHATTTRMDLLLTDVVMPKMNGRELAEQVVSLCPKIRVLFASGYAEALLDQPQHSLVPVVYLEKPYSLTTLAHKLRAVLDHPR